MHEVSHSEILKEIGVLRDETRVGREEQHADSKALWKQFRRFERVLTGGLEGDTEGVLERQRRHDAHILRHDEDLRSIKRRLEIRAEDTGRHSAMALESQTTITVERWKAWAAVAVALLTAVGAALVAWVAK